MEKPGPVYYIVSLKDHCQSSTSKSEPPPGLAHPHGQEMGDFLHIFSHLRGSTTCLPPSLTATVAVEGLGPL